MRTKMRARGCFTTDASFCIHRAGKIRKTRDAIESTNTDETTLLKERHQYLPAIFLYFNALQNKFCLWEKRKKIASKISFWRAVHFSFCKFKGCVTNSLQVFWSRADDTFSSLYIIIIETSPLTTYW